MRRFISVAAVLLIHIMASAQSDSQMYEQRYDLIVSKLGPAAVGVETVLNNWENADSTNAKMLFGKFRYYFTKAQTAEVVARSTPKYLGMEPILSLKDSLGNDVYYYQENIFDDQMYAQAIKAADRAISFWPSRLDFRFMKANAYIAYEKESPDMALAFLQNLVKENASRSESWEYDGAQIDDEFFQDAMQEYCFSFYSISSQASYEAFMSLSKQLSEYYPDNMGFINNIGSYYLIGNQYKSALKYYDKVLKKIPDDYTALQNALIATRRMKNVKLEKKYLKMMVRYGSEKDKLLAQGRLDALDLK